MDNRISIHASFKDCIESIIHYNETALPDFMKTKEVIKDNSNDKKEIVHLLNTCISFQIEENEIIFVVNRSEEEIKQYHLERKINLKHCIRRLKNWYNSKQEYKEEITQYLEYKNLNWIIKEIKG